MFHLNQSHPVLDDFRCSNSFNLSRQDGVGLELPFTSHDIGPCLLPNFTFQGDPWKFSTRFQWVVVDGLTFYHVMDCLSSHFSKHLQKKGALPLSPEEDVLCFWAASALMGRLQSHRPGFDQATGSKTFSIPMTMVIWRCSSVFRHTYTCIYIYIYIHM